MKRKRKRECFSFTSFGEKNLPFHIDSGCEGFLHVGENSLVISRNYFSRVKRLEKYIDIFQKLNIIYNTLYNYKMERVFL